MFYWRTVSRSTLTEYSGLSASGIVLFALLLYAALMWMGKRLMAGASAEAIKASLAGGGLVLFLIVRIIFHLLCSLASGLQKVPVVLEASGLLGGLLGAGIATIWILVFSVFLNTPVFANGTACADSTLVGKISEPVSETMSELGIQTNSMKALNKLFTDMNSMDDSDKQAVAKWLESHGYEKLEEGIQISLPSDGDRNESAGEQS